MKPLALPKLPDRNPVKRTMVCEPELNKALEDYARLYRETYGETESVETLIPFMLTAFLAKDRAFAGFRKSRVRDAESGRRADLPEGHGRRPGRSGAGSQGMPPST